MHLSTCVSKSETNRGLESLATLPVDVLLAARVASMLSAETETCFMYHPVFV